LEGGVEAAHNLTGSTQVSQLRPGHTGGDMFTKIADSLKDPEDFGPPGFGSVNICTDPDPYIIQQEM